MQLTDSFISLLQVFAPVFTAPTFQTFVAILSGWVLSQRHRYVTECIFSSGQVGVGHWSKFHRFFSHAAWDSDRFSMVLAKLLVATFARDDVIQWAVDDTLCRKRGLKLHGAGMHHDPLISSRAKPLVSWGHDWVVICLIVANPNWARSKVFALPVAARLYRNRQGVAKGRKDRGATATSKAVKPGPDPNHRTRPELARELIATIARWFPDREHLVVGDSAYGGQSVLSYLPSNVHLISHVHSKGAIFEPPPSPRPKARGRARKKGDRLPGMKEWAADASRPWTEADFKQFGLHTRLGVKSIQGLYYTAGKDRLLTIILTRDLVGKRPDQMFYCTKIDWSPRQVLSAYACRWAIECTFENSKQLLGFEDPANRLPKAVERTAPTALYLYSLIVTWFHRVGHESVRFPLRPWYRHKAEPSFGDMLTTLRRISHAEITPQPPAERTDLKTWIAQITELLSRAG